VNCACPHAGPAGRFHVRRRLLQPRAPVVQNYVQIILADEAVAAGVALAARGDNVAPGVQDNIKIILTDQPVAGQVSGGLYSWLILDLVHQQVFGAVENAADVHAAVAAG